MDEARGMDPETRRIVEESGGALMAKRVGKRTVSQLIAEDQTPRPYSVRLSPGELHRLRGMARVTGIEASKLARQFILDGLIRLEAQVEHPASGSPDSGRIQAIKLTLLDLYDQVVGLEGHGQGLDAGSEPRGT